MFIHLTVGEHLQILGEKDEGLRAKVAFLYKTSDISERKQSTAKVTTECL